MKYTLFAKHKTFLVRALVFSRTLGLRGTEGSCVYTTAKMGSPVAFHGTYSSLEFWSVTMGRHFQLLQLSRTVVTHTSERTGILGDMQQQGCNHPQQEDQRDRKMLLQQQHDVIESALPCYRDIICSDFHCTETAQRVCSCVSLHLGVEARISLPFYVRFEPELGDKKLDGHTWCI